MGWGSGTVEMKTLAELLDLLPDNTTGAIGADDLRTITTELYHIAASANTALPYQWTTNLAPPSGKVTLNQGWATLSNAVLISETANDGTVVGFMVLDNSVGSRVYLTGKTGGKLTANVTGPSVDMGTYRSVPVSVIEVIGTTPAGNDDITVTFLAVMA